METEADFIFLGSKITADCDCSHEIKRHLLLGRKPIQTWTVYWKAETLLCQQRPIMSKLWFYPADMYSCESCNIKKAECQRIDALKFWSWRRLLRVPWTARRSNQPILKKISPEHSLEGLMLKLELQSFGHLMQRADSLEKTLMLGKTEGRRGRGQQRMRWLMAS